MNKYRETKFELTLKTESCPGSLLENSFTNSHDFLPYISLTSICHLHNCNYTEISSNKWNVWGYMCVYFIHLIFDIGLFVFSEKGEICRWDESMDLLRMSILTEI